MTGCHEGALQIIDGKARLINDLFCDGLGACIGTCPVDAIEFEEREAEPYDEETVIRSMLDAGENTVVAHLRHLREHGESQYVHQAFKVLESVGWNVPDIKKKVLAGVQVGAPHQGGGCPGSAVRQMHPAAGNFGGLANPAAPVAPAGPAAPGVSRLGQWPVQMKLVPVGAPFFNGADLLVSADCVPFAYANFHEDFLKDRVVLVGCPKLDDVAFYQEKLTAIFSQNQIRSVTVVKMEVPCCGGIAQAVKNALAASGKIIPLADVTVGVEGDLVRR